MRKYLILKLFVLTLMLPLIIIGSIARFVYDGLATGWKSITVLFLYINVKSKFK